MAITVTVKRRSDESGYAQLRENRLIVWETGFGNWAEMMRIVQEAVSIGWESRTDVRIKWVYLGFFDELSREEEPYGEEDDEEEDDEEYEPPFYDTDNEALFPNDSDKGVEEEYDEEEAAQPGTD